MPKRNVIIHAVHAGGTKEHEPGQSSWEAAQHQAEAVSIHPSTLGHEGTIQKLADWREKNKNRIEAARANLAKFLEESNK